MIVIEATGINYQLGDRYLIYYNLDRIPKYIQADKVKIVKFIGKHIFIEIVE